MFRVNRRFWYYFIPLLLVSGAFWQISRTSLRAQGGSVTLTIDTANDQHSISPYIYGINFADDTLAAEMNVVDLYGRFRPAPLPKSRCYASM